MAIDHKCEGKEITLDVDHRMPEIEERRNLHIGKPYRVGTEAIYHDGILTKLIAHVCDKGFVLGEVELRDGLTHGLMVPAPDTFDLKRFGPDCLEFCAFGSIIDEEGFKRAREKYKWEDIT